MRRSPILSAILFAACQPHATSGALIPTADSASLCELDAQCPPGSYCQAGVCDFACRVDLDCGTGGSCGARGRCGPPPTAPAPFAGRLVAGVDHLSLALNARQGSVHLENQGSADIAHFHVVSDDPAVSASPARGTLPAGKGLDLTVSLQPAWTGRAMLHVLTSGGNADIAVASGSNLTGHVEGSVAVTSPYLLGNAHLALDIVQSEGVGSNLTGTLDDSGSLLWPYRAAVTGSDDGTNVVLTFSWVADPLTPGNPLGDAQVQRVVTLVGTHQGGGPVVGTYAEVLTGFGASPVTVAGTFQLAWAGPTKGLVADAQPTFRPPVAPGPLGTAQCPADRSDCPPGPSAQAQWFFTQAFPFEAWAWGSSIVKGQCQLAQGLLPVPCVETGFELPAAQALATAGGLGNAWEAYRAEASAALLQGNDLIANTLEPDQAAYQGPAVDAQTLRQALGVLAAGLHQNQGLGGILFGSNLWLAQANPGSPSQLDNALDDQHRFGGIVRTSLFAAVQRLGALVRDPDTLAASVSREAQAAATAALLDAAALATLALDGASVPPAPGGSLQGSEVPFAQVALTFERLRKGLNPAGYPVDYVPFAFDPTQPVSDLFGQMMAQANLQLAPATALEGQLRQANRDFEASASALQTALLDVASQAGTTVTDLCGSSADPSTGAGCGAGGKLGVDMADLTAAQAALADAQSRSSSAADKIVLLQTQLQIETMDQAHEIQLLQADGTTLAAAAWARAGEQLQNLWWQCGLGVTTTLGQVVAQVFVNPLAALGSLFGGGGQNALACEEADNQKDALNREQMASMAQSDMQLQVTFAANEVRDDTLRSQIFDAIAASNSAFFDAQRQLGLLNAASAQVQADFANLQEALTLQAAKDQQQQARIDPTFRLYRDQTGEQWAAQVETVRKWAFLATRAFEYETNQSYPQGAGVWSAATAAQLTSYLALLQDAYASAGLSEGWAQNRVDVISLRRDILGITGSITDPVLGQVITPEAQFRAALAAPKNRDASGRLALAFSTETASGGVPLFSNDVCEDRLVDLKMNVVSSTLQGGTAYFGLTQKGPSQFADCLDGQTTTYTLPTKSALVAAGLNLPPSAETDPSIPPNTDLSERPVVGQSWVLSFDSQGDSRNSWIDLTQVDDLELWIHHQARTKQQL